MRVAHIAIMDASLAFPLRRQLLYLADRGFDVAGISAPGLWVEDLERSGIRHIPWRRPTRGVDLLRDVRAFRELVGILRRERFDLVHTHYPKAGVLGRAAARLAGVPYVVNTMHGLYVEPDAPIATRLLVLGAEGAAARLSDCELYQSESDLRRLGRLRLAPRSKAVLLGNGIDLEHFDPGRVRRERTEALRTELGLPDGAAVIGTVGRLVAAKGHHDVGAAVKLLRAAGHKVALLALTPADREKADALERSELASNDSDVVLTDWRSDVCELLAIMDVFVLASRREGIPRSPIEAAAMGKPLVLTDLPGCREIVRDGREGFLVPVGDVGRLARALETLIRQPEVRASYGAAAQRRVRERFDERRVLATIEHEYRRLLAGAPRRRRFRTRLAGSGAAPRV